MKKRLFITVTCLFLVLALYGCGNNEEGATSEENGETITLNMSHMYTENEPGHKGAVQFAEKVNERSDGMIEIIVHPNATLGSDPDVTEQAQMGGNVIVYSNPSYLIDYSSDIGILSAPFLAENWEEMTKVVQSDFMDEQKEIFSENGLRLLDFSWYFGQRHVFAKESIEGPEDLNGLILRSQPGVIGESTIKAIGASPTSLPWAEVYSAIEQGVIDGAEAPLPTIYDSKMHEVVTDVALTGHQIQANGWVMSEQVFSSIPEEHQQILLEEAAAASEMMSQLTLDAEQEYQELLKDEGITVTEIPKEYFTDYVNEFHNALSDRWTDENLYERIQGILEN